MDVPETLYAKTPDGLHIAYQVVGEGVKDLVFLPYIGCIDAIWDEPSLAHTLRRLSEIGRVVLLDYLTQGSSDRVPLGALPTIEAWADDVRVVLDAVGSTRAVVVGHGIGAGQIAMFFAATHPERTEGLVLIDTAARALRDEGYPLGLPIDRLPLLLDLTEQNWGRGAMTDLMAPSRAGDESFRRWQARYERLAASPSTLRSLLDWAMKLDLRETLENIRVPTVVFHTQGNMTLRPDLGRYLADHITGASFVELPGADMLFFAENGDRVVDEIEEFVTGVRPVREPDRALATVLFTDIVGSTQSVATLGDKRWTELLDRHDKVVEAELERYRGRKVNPTGDGILATFDGPARAIRCARTICDAVRPLGIEVRAGLHTGEVELRGDDIGGIAVHIGQRVSALAGPGEVLVSRTVTDLVAGSGLQFEERGEHALNGVPGTWMIYAVRP